MKILNKKTGITEEKYISCKNCIYKKTINNQRYYGCKLGKGIFPKSSTFLNCSGYKTKKMLEEEQNDE